MISLAGRDIMHAWGKFVFTGMGLGLLIGIAGSKQATYEKYGYDDAMRTQIDVGTFA